jgi:hypothetical protein
VIGEWWERYRLSREAAIQDSLGRSPRDKEQKRFQCLPCCDAELVNRRLCIPFVRAFSDRPFITGIFLRLRARLS